MSKTFEHKGRKFEIVEQKENRCWIEGDMNKVCACFDEKIESYIDCMEILDAVGLKMCTGIIFREVKE